MKHTDGKQAVPDSRDTEAAKVVQSEVRVGVVVQDTASGHYHFITGMLPCPLSVVDRATAETLHEVHTRVCDGLPGLGPRFRALFDQDSCNANEKQVKVARRDDAQKLKPQNRLSLGCDIHRTATVATKTFSLADKHISGCLSFAISQHGPGRFTSSIHRG